MGQAHGQVETFEDPAVDHPGDAQRRFHRVADELGEPVIALAVRVGHPTRVNEDEHVALGQQGPKVLVHRVIELFATSAGADRDARETQVVEAASGLVRGVGKSEGDRPEAVQPAGALGDVAGEFVVAARDGCGDKLSVFGVGAVQKRRHGHRMGSNPDVVHLGQPGARVVLGAGEGERCVLRHSAHRWIEQDDVVSDPRQIRKAVAFEPFEQRQRHRVVVHVDRRGISAVRFRRPAGVGFVCGHPVPPRHSGSKSMLAARVLGSYGFLLDGT